MNNIKTIVCLARAGSLCVLLVGCSSIDRPSESASSDTIEETRLDIEGIQGDWYFANVSRAPIPVAPPTFDIMEFHQDGTLKLKSTLHKWSFDGMFTNAGQNITMSFHVPDKASPAELHLKVALAKDGESLFASNDDTKYVFYRKNKFLDSDVVGRWTCNEDGGKQTMLLGEDGSYSLIEGNVKGYYRLWQSQYGKTITAVFIVSDEGGFTVCQQYQRTGDNLVLTPIGPNGLMKDGAITFTLSK
jgi:hypothetical protein